MVFERKRFRKNGLLYYRNDQLPKGVLCTSLLHCIRRTSLCEHVMSIDRDILGNHSILQSEAFNSVGRNISALVGCIKKLRALYEVQLLEIYKIPQLNLI